MDFILPYKEAEELLRAEIDRIKTAGFFDYNEEKPVYSTKETGIMLGLLVARTKTGEKLSLKAFSGALNGSFIVSTYTPPCFSVKAFEEIVSEYDSKIHCYTDRIEAGEKELESHRRLLSNECLDKIRALYSFYTPQGKKIGFKDMNLKPIPTGTGDCAAIKLLSYCFKRGFEPVSLAEIYFGKESNNRLDGQLYPPCDEKCKPILPHILGINLLYSDEAIAIINKDEGMLSVPGRGEDKHDSASVRIKELFPSAPELPSVHRHDMDTTGILVIAKTEEAKRKLSMQFEARETEKVYVALLRGLIKEESGVIDLPMRLDVDNRPYQIIDFLQGKKAVTNWKKIKVEILNGEKVSRIRFYPHTGRTHQIRVHAASGLHTPIVGDRLYGERREGERLCLHAESLTFTHPLTGERVTFKEDAPF